MVTKFFLSLNILLQISLNLAETSILSSYLQDAVYPYKTFSSMLKSLRNYPSRVLWRKSINKLSSSQISFPSPNDMDWQQILSCLPIKQLTPKRKFIDQV